MAKSGAAWISSEVMSPKRSLYQRFAARKSDTFKTTWPRRTTLAAPAVTGLVVRRRVR